MRAFVVVICLLIGAPAAAQSTSIGVTANWDFARYSRVEIDEPSLTIDPAADSLDGDALGFTVSVRRAIGEDWGVAAEFSRTGEIESRTTRRISPIRGIPTLPTLPTIPGVGQIPIPLPPFPIPDFELTLQSEQQHQTIAALAWVRHDVGDRLDLSYTGGISFVRSEYERELTITDQRLAIFVAPTDLSTVDLSIGAAVGVDADVELTDHTAFTAGVRLQSLGGDGRGGWLVRPTAGVRWTF
jgi:hypothetical protein